jgi:glutamine---fructose-6-phosphate transaminase (isomerizing)
MIKRIGMNSIDAMATEIKYQVEDLPKLELPKQVKANNSVIVGSGDSYAAALIAQYASNHRVVCCNPMDILINPNIIGDRQVFIVSVSGNTIANVIAAKIATKKRIPTTAITANPKSKLAKICDNIIELRFKTVKVPTAGTIAFTSSMLVCLSLVKKIDSPCNLDTVLKQANYEIEDFFSTNEKSVRYASYSSYVLLGNGILFPIAMYGALKINEVLGSKAFAYPVEEFFHSPLFSTKVDDQIIILDNQHSDDNYKNKKLKILYEKIREIHFPTLFADCSGESLTDSLLKAIFFLQLFVLKHAQKRGMKDCYFLDNKELLKTSSDIIYGGLSRYKIS